MNLIPIAKGAVSFVVGAGTSKIVASVIKNNATPENTKDLVTMTAGGIVLSAMVADASKKYTDSLIDQAVVIWNDCFNKKQEDPEVVEGIIQE